MERSPEPQDHAKRRSTHYHIGPSRNT